MHGFPPRCSAPAAGLTMRLRNSGNSALHGDPVMPALSPCSLCLASLDFFTIKQAWGYQRWRCCSSASSSERRGVVNLAMGLAAVGRFGSLMARFRIFVPVFSYLLRCTTLSRASAMTAQTGRILIKWVAYTTNCLAEDQLSRVRRFTARASTARL